MNRAIILGNLGSDPELRYTQNQTAVCKFSVATNKRSKDKDEVTWHNVIVWGKPAEVCSKHLSKGSKVLVEGEIVHRKYTDKNGVERHVTEIQTWSHVEFVSPKKEQGGAGHAADHHHAPGGNPGLDDIPF